MIRPFIRTNRLPHRQRPVLYCYRGHLGKPFRVCPKSSEFNVATAERLCYVLVVSLGGRVWRVGWSWRNRSCKAVRERILNERALVDMWRERAEAAGWVRP